MTKLKILICGLKEQFGGVEQVILNYAKPIIESGINCTFLVDSNSPKLLLKISSIGGEVIPLSFGRKRYFAYKKALKTIFLKNKFDAVWCNYSGLTNIDVLKFAKKANIDVRICHAHTSTLDHKGFLMGILVPILHFKNKLKITKFATDFWGCSEKSLNFMFPKNVKSKIIKNAISPSRFHPNTKQRKLIRQKLNLANNFVIGHTARLTKLKNQKFLILLFCEFFKLNNNAKLLIVGDGELKQELEQLAKTLNLCENIIFTGEVTDVENYYQAMDIFCLPSLAEGLGMAVIEAQSCGLACVVSDRVPKECDISGCVKFLPLKTDFKDWCNAISTSKKVTNPKTSLLKSGYNLDIESNWIINFFKGGV